MLAIIDIIVPVFGILALGFLAARLRYLSDGAARAITEFAFKAAMPALLFRAMLAIKPLPDSPWRLVAVFAGAVTILWLLTTLLTRVLLRRPAVDAPAIAMGVCFGNCAMLGVPLALTAFGPEAAGPVAILISLDSPVLWIVATLHMEAVHRFQLHNAGSWWLALRQVIFDLLRNPIILPIIVGTLWRFTDLGIHARPPSLDLHRTSHCGAVPEGAQ